jgi:hypothetical protein
MGSSCAYLADGMRHCHGQRHEASPRQVSSPSASTREPVTTSWHSATRARAGATARAQARRPGSGGKRYRSRPTSVSPRPERGHQGEQACNTSARAYRTPPRSRPAASVTPSRLARGCNGVPGSACGGHGGVSRTQIPSTLTRNTFPRPPGPRRGPRFCASEPWSCASEPWSSPKQAATKSSSQTKDLSRTSTRVTSAAPGVSLPNSAPLCMPSRPSCRFSTLCQKAAWARSWTVLSPTTSTAPPRRGGRCSSTVSRLCRLARDGCGRIS